MKRKRIYYAGVVCAVGVLWFLGVQRTWHVHDCPHCGSYAHVITVRIFGKSIRQDVQWRNTLAQAIATDLGAACRHQDSTYWCKQRHWGLLICAFPCVNGTLRPIVDEKEYSSEMRRAVLELRKSDKDLAGEFYKRVILAGDQDYLQAFLQTLETGSFDATQ